MSSTPAALEKAALLFDSARYSDAIKILSSEYSSAPKVGPLAALLRVNRASCYSRLELWKHCITDCDAALEADKDCQAAFILKGRALSRQGKPDAAANVWCDGARVVGDFETRAVLRQLAEGAGAAIEQAMVESEGQKASTADTSAAAVPGSEAAAASVAAQGLVQHGVGDAEMDKLIAIGYLQVNTGQLVKGIDHFSALLRSNPRLVAAYLGRGTAQALRGSLEAAIEDFGRAAAIDASCADAWLRLGQARAAAGGEEEALADLDKAVALRGPSVAEALQQRGQLHFRRKNYRAALADYRAVAEAGQSTAQLWNLMGLAATGLGDLEEGIAAFARASAIEPRNRECWSNMAQAWRELGQLDKALALYDRALAADPRWAQARHLRGMALFGAGRHAEALRWFDEAAAGDPGSAEHVFMRGVARHGLGMLAAAAADYAAVVAAKADHPAWYQRECALLLRARLQQPLRSFDYDAAVDPYLKEAWAKRHHPATLARYRPAPSPGADGLPADLCPAPPPASAALEALLRRADALGALLQYDAKGFLAMRRQQRAAGLAVVQAAQWLRAELGWGAGRSSSGSGGSGGWREVFGAVARWRQLAEPNDPVWWVDKLSPEQFAEGYGSHTPMLTGQTKVVRYHSQCARAFALLRALAVLPPRDGGLSLPRDAVDAAREPLDVYQLVRRDCYVATPCVSARRGGGGRALEGTRLTLQAVPQGVEFSIRTPCTPARWAEYDSELADAWAELCAAATAAAGAGDAERASALALRVAFYWYNFMPLSRGTAAVGFAFILAAHIAIGAPLDAPLPKDMQPDWEAILCPTHSGFAAALAGWLSAARAGGQERDYAAFWQLPQLDAVIRTVGDAITALNTVLP